MDQENQNLEKQAPEISFDAPTQEPAQSSGTPVQAGEKTPMGPIVGIIVIIIVLVVGGLYFWGQRISTSVDENLTPEEITIKEDTATEALKTQGTSDVVADIEADLSATNLDNLDAELQQIEAELTF